MSIDSLGISGDSAENVQPFNYNPALIKLDDPLALPIA
jgi:hypothetical protein